MPPTFETLLSDLSTRFTGLPADAVDAEVEWALRSVVEWLGTDRATLFLITGEDSMRATHSWARPGLPTVGSAQTSGLLWYCRALASGQVLAFSRLPDDLPVEAVRERAYAEQAGFKSNLSVPIAVGGCHVCAIATGTFSEHRSWDESTVSRLRFVGQILANAVNRQQSELRMREQLDEIRSLKDRLEAENLYLREEVRGGGEFRDVVGRSPALRRTLERIAQVAPTDSSVLLLGETGTGKELMARAVHERSPRQAKAFIKVNCAALPATLIESELFGHEKGAFTGATAAHAGRFELADGGTLFLDEIGELLPELQVKLLRVLQDGEVQRLGSTKVGRVDVRLVAATNQDLDSAVAAGRFRQDLFYRLNVFPVRVPPLRERREDIPLLTWAFIQRRGARLRRRIETVPQETMDALRAYDWPGNVRELENVLERALILSPGPSLRLDGPLGPGLPTTEAPPAPAAFDAVAREHIRAILERCGWRINGPDGAAEILSLHPNTLRSRMKKLGIARPRG